MLTAGGCYVFGITPEAHRCRKLVKNSFCSAAATFETPATGLRSTRKLLFCFFYLKRLPFSKCVMKRWKEELSRLSTPDCVFQLAAAKVFVVSYVNNLKLSVLKHFR